MTAIYTLEKITSIVGGELLGDGAKQIGRLLIDSRKVTDADAGLFFAIRGARQDGHDYVKELENKGVKAFVVEEIPDKHSDQSSFIKVDNTILALQKLAEYHRAEFSYPVIAITGSNGKTIVKEWLNQLLREDMAIVRSPKSYNSQVGVPLSVWQMTNQSTMGIFEAGISKPNEMSRLASILKPNYVLLTNLGHAHQENFNDIEQKLKEKLTLAQHAEYLLYCKDNPEVEEGIKEFKRTYSGTLINWSRSSDADLVITNLSKNKGQTIFEGNFKGQEVSVCIPFADDASIENAIHCWLLCLILGVPNKVIQQRMKLLQPVAMRLELIKGVNGCNIINDSYNSDLESIYVALDFLDQQESKLSRVFILSDILENNIPSKELYKEIASVVRQKNIERFYGIGKSLLAHAHLFDKTALFYPDTSSFLNDLSKHMFKENAILIKGARSFKFERIVKELQLKVHQTVLEVNLNAIVSNLNYYRSLLPTKTMVMAMVKAFSYGTGSYEIANLLKFHNVDYLAVAYADEGVELRKEGIELPILVMNPEVEYFDKMIKYNLEPELYSIRTLKLFIESLKSSMVHLGSKPFSIHLKLETGMKRLGFEKEDVFEMIELVKSCDLLKVSSVFTHLAASGNADHDDFTLQQLNTFEKLSERVISELGYSVLRHALNTSGISRFNNHCYDMVRLGIGMYGVGIDEKEQAALQNVCTLKTTISQIKKISKGESIGYERSFTSEKDGRIAVLPIGYADGLSRGLSNGKGVVYVGRKMANIVGNVCMDMCMIDVSGLEVSEGDEVLIFYDATTLKKMASALDTIPYEVLTGISRRVKRLYYQE